MVTSPPCSCVKLYPPTILSESSGWLISHPVSKTAITTPLPVYPCFHFVSEPTSSILVGILSSNLLADDTSQGIIFISEFFMTIHPF